MIIAAHPSELVSFSGWPTFTAITIPPPQAGEGTQEPHESCRGLWGREDAYGRESEPDGISRVVMWQDQRGRDPC
jgi:hypothetical protein